MLSDGAKFVNLYEIIFPVRKQGDKGFLPLCAMSSSPGSAALGKSPCARRELGGDPRDLYERVLAFLQAVFFQQPAKFSDRLTAVLPPTRNSPSGSPFGPIGPHWYANFGDL